jgi:hypothetical protein
MSGSGFASQANVTLDNACKEQTEAAKRKDIATA